MSAGENCQSSAAHQTLNDVSVCKKCLLRLARLTGLATTVKGKKHAKTTGHPLSNHRTDNNLL